ncbi:phosphotransferase [Deinococcus aestuarii]|uniref:phosphotransferase n=1 Tax=Deinococcus aestuarii TaxID=2774531 RepID=UPI001C0CFE29|nr:phosphotransferase [Deinococcus aestuarii]
MTTSEERRWPDALLSVQDALIWIQAALPPHHTAQGPTALLNVKAWGVVARFHVLAPEPYDVVFKVGALPLFRSAPRAFELAHLARPHHTPELLASRQDGEQTWTLFRAFEGHVVRDAEGTGAVVEMARELARVQAAVLTLPESARLGLPHFPLTSIPTQFDQLLTLTRERYLPIFEERRQDFRSTFNLDLPPNLAERLEVHRGRVQTWTDELAAMNWPESLDHVDLHHENGVVQPDGSVLLLDWEEAQLALPFFSLDRLLEDAREYDERAGIPQAVTGIDGTPTVLAVRAAYLDTLPWRTWEERATGLDLALQLAPIKALAEGEAFNDALGRERGNPVQAAFLLLRALRRWEASC